MPQHHEIAVANEVAEFLRSFNLHAYKLALTESGSIKVLSGDAYDLEYFANRLSRIGFHDEEQLVADELLLTIAAVVKNAAARDEGESK